MNIHNISLGVQNNYMYAKTVAHFDHYLRISQAPVISDAYKQLFKLFFRTWYYAYVPHTKEKTSFSRA